LITSLKNIQVAIHSVWEVLRNLQSKCLLLKGAKLIIFRCKTNQKEVCSIPLDKLAPIDDSPGFWVDFMPFRGLGYQPYLISILPFKTQRFTLLNTVGNCGTQLKDNYLYDSDPSLYKSCFCCGDKYNPDPSLNCPVSPWS
jgi:hypothetical protein